MDELSLDRYQVRRVLGRGGNGVVYEAYDTETDSVVALKTIQRPLGEELYRLKREFRALADLQHRNLIRFGELACEKDQWFFTMELVRGKGFVEHVRPRTSAPVGSGAPPSAHAALRGGPRMDEGRLRDALAQLEDVLSTIHEAGHVHRDVKPANVLVAEDGRVVLLDFGLVAHARRDGDREEEQEEVLGTPAFMAPEQVDGAQVSPAADWYAVGVMLFLALTGRLPFEGGDLQAMNDKTIRSAPAPHDFVPGVPADLDALCIDLLSIDPAKRPAAAEIRQRLRISGGRVTAEPPADEVRDPLGVFVGRTRELEQLGAALARTREGRRAFVLVEGEAGMGKSALVQRFLSELPGDVLVLGGRCYEQEAVPFKGIDAVIDELTRHLGSLSEADLDLVLAGGARYLATIFPVLRRLPRVEAIASESRGVENPATLSEQAADELERLLEALATRAPVVVFIDDLQWADAEGASLLRRLLLARRTASCFFLATLRSGSAVAGGLAAEERVVLAPLSDVESRELWGALWPTYTSRTDAARRQTELVKEAEGHPLLLAEFVRSA
ncbi:MAG TPA: AAA family ATPase, partial [Polyangiaceae bacterium]